MKRITGKLEPLLYGNRLLFFDGAMGTMIQAEGITGRVCPEELNLADPGLIRKIHRSYVNAGAQVLTTNTFGANRMKLSKVGLEDRLDDIIASGVSIARKAAGTNALVAGSIGPLGEYLDPVGPVSPEKALEIFRDTARLFREAGADLLIIETMSDLKEVRAACMAAYDSSLPFIVTMTFEEEGRSVLGTPPEAFAITAESLGAALVGVNCSLGPENLLPVVQRMAAISRTPIIVQPNAGMPVLEGGRTVFPTGPLDFSKGMEQFLISGVRAYGGCCGTTPDHIENMIKRLEGRHPGIVECLPGCRLASRSGFVLVGGACPVAVVGERINPTGRKKLAGELKQGNLESIREDLIGQVKAGAHLLDLNAGSAGINETELLPRIVELAQKTISVPLVIDSTNQGTLKAALSVIEGRPLINSVNASSKSLLSILPLAARYGAAVIGLTMDENGIPADAAGRILLAEKIIRAAEDHGLDPSDLLIDCLAMAVGSEQNQVMESLRAIQTLKQSQKAGTILGVSNVSYGLPSREELNTSFLSMAVYCGLDAAIVNPYSLRIMDALAASVVLSGRDVGASSFIERFGQKQPETVGNGGKDRDPREIIGEAVLHGDADGLLKQVQALLDEGLDPMVIGQDYLITALEKVGTLFEKKAVFLPQVIASAEAVREAFSVVKARAPKSSEGKELRVLLASVEGDVHDLGKNILKTLLENHGYLVEDLGINVPARIIVERTLQGDIHLVGLSALMTTTLPAMEETVKHLKKELPGVPVIVGGAVLTEDYARNIGADGYAPDASIGVKLVKALLSPDANRPGTC